MGKRTVVNRIQTHLPLGVKILTTKNYHDKEGLRRTKCEYFYNSQIFSMSVRNKAPITNEFNYTKKLS